MGVREPDALGGQPVDVRSRDAGIGIVTSRVAVAHVVREDQDDIGPPIGSLSAAGLGNAHESRKRSRRDRRQTRVPKELTPGPGSKRLHSSLPDPSGGRPDVFLVVSGGKEDVLSHSGMGVAFNKKLFLS
ncbi:MAG: hypothetical protein MZV63_58920 [Marinilabiliales bacterium]|nr:hypothetical protein [Marinilabiliales bacterium]